MGEVAGDGSRLMTGLKYYRITGKDVEKAPYQPGICARAGVGARRQLRLQPLQAGRRARARPDARPAHRRRAVRRGALRTLVVRGADLPRGGLSTAARDRRPGGAHHAPAVPRSPSGDRRGDAERQLVGGRRIRRGVGRPRGGVDVASRAPRDALCALAGREAPPRGRAPRASARPVDPRALAPAVERLALHPQDGHGDAVRRKARSARTCIACVTSGTWSRRGPSRETTRPGSTTSASATTSSRASPATSSAAGSTPTPRKLHTPPQTEVRALGPVGLGSTLRPSHLVLAFARNVAPLRRYVHGPRHPVPGRAGPTHRLARARRTRRRAGRRGRRRRRPLRDHRGEPDALARRARRGRGAHDRSARPSVFRSSPARGRTRRARRWISRSTPSVPARTP